MAKKKRNKKNRQYLVKFCDGCEMKTKFHIRYENKRYPRYFCSPILHFFWNLFKLNSFVKIKERIETCSRCGNIYVKDIEEKIIRNK